MAASTSAAIHGGKTGGRRYPSPLVKQDLAKLGKDADSRRAALASLRSFVEEHLAASSLPRFLQQVAESRDGRLHAASLARQLARTHGPRLAPHIPRLLRILVHTLLATAGGNAVLLTDCANAVVDLAQYCCSPRDTAPEILGKLCGPLIALLSAKLPPLSSGAAACLAALVESETWKFAPAPLVAKLCLKASIAVTAPPTQTTAHMQLLRSLATANASALEHYGQPLLRLVVEILLSSSAPWQHRLSALHLLESLLKAADSTTLSSQLRPCIDALSKCRHDKIPSIRKASLNALQTANSLNYHPPPSNNSQHQPLINTALELDYDDPWFSGFAQRSHISDSPLTSPRNLSQSSPRSIAESSKLKLQPPFSTTAANGDESRPADESDYFCAYFYDSKENGSCRKIVHHIHDATSTPNTSFVSPKGSPRTPNTKLKASSVSSKASPRTSSPARKSVPSLPLSQVIQAAESDVRSKGTLQHSAGMGVRYLPEDTRADQAVTSITRNIMVLDSNDELVASCERSLNDNYEGGLASADVDLEGKICNKPLDSEDEDPETEILRQKLRSINFRSSPEEDEIRGTHAAKPNVHDQDNGEVRKFMAAVDNNLSMYSARDTAHLDGILNDLDSSSASVSLFNSLAQLASSDKQAALKTADMLAHCDGLALLSRPPLQQNVEAAASESSASEFLSLTNEQTNHEVSQGSGEQADAEVETSSGEWSVRDNPIAEDHGDDKMKQEPEQSDPQCMTGSRNNNKQKESPRSKEIFTEDEGAPSEVTNEEDGDINGAIETSYVGEDDEGGKFEEEEDSMKKKSKVEEIEEMLSVSEEVEEEKKQSEVPKLSLMPNTSRWNTYVMRGVICAAGLMISIAMTVSMHFECLQQLASHHPLPPT